MAATFDPLGAPKAAGGAKSATKTPASAATTTANNSRPTGQTQATSGYKDGTFQGSDYSNPYGDVQVSVTISGGKITAVSLDQLTAEDGRSQQINSEAAPLLRSQALSAQSANIDGVSGASYTTSSYEESLQSALDKAKT